MKKLRLLITEECNRNCSGCCNKDWDLQSLIVEQDYTKYDLIMLTGGEPMLNYEETLSIIIDIKSKSKAKIIVYTAKIDKLSEVLSVLGFSDGITVTLHEPFD
ncbi:MAG: 4Fe-4S cluster-binding domain-containing protein, partial [Pseudomonadota bacterium]